MMNDARYRIRALFRRPLVDTELNDELRFHFERLVEKKMRSGMARADAERAARLEFGGHDQVTQSCRDSRGTRLAETLIQDGRYTLRAMMRNPAFFTVAILTLALGIGASTAVFSVVNTILLKALPYPDAGRIMMLWRGAPITAFPGIVDFPWNVREFATLSDKPEVFENLAAFKKDTFNLTGGGDPELLEGVRTSSGLFATLGVQPMLGRTFAAGEDKDGHDHVAVLSHELWRSRFDADPGIAGKSIALNGTAYTVIGVMPASFTFPSQRGIPPMLDLPEETQLWVPLVLPANLGGSNDMGIVARLKPGIGEAQLGQSLDAYQRGLEAIQPGEKGWSVHWTPLARQLVMDERGPLRLLLGAVGVVLLIACANVGGLVLNRSLRRRREISLRGALGADRRRLVRQLLTENLMLAVAGGGLGTLLGLAAVALVRRFGPAGIPQLRETALDLHGIAFAIGITFLAGILAGLGPALASTRTNLVEAMKEGNPRAGAGGAAPHLRNAMLVLQMALALVLVVAAGLLVRTFQLMLRADAGFEASRVVTFELPLPVPKYADTARMEQLYAQVLLALRGTAGVRSAGLVTVVPMAGAPDSTVIRIPEHPTPAGASAKYANYSFVSPDYFKTIGAPILRGRDFAASDRLNTMPVTIINTAMAKAYFAGEDPIGKQVGVGSTRYPVRTIVAVVDVIKHGSLREEPTAEMYVPFTQNEIKVWPSMQAMQFAVKSEGSISSITDGIRQAVHGVDADIPVAKLAAPTTLVDNSMTADRFAMILVASFGLLALILASIGMYGVISYSVEQRTAEIGIRIALGAKRREILVMILGQAGRLALTGIAIGLVAGLAAARLMMRFLYGVKPTDPLTFAAVSLLLLAAGVLACYVPARKAMKVDPLTALRCE